MIFNNVNDLQVIRDFEAKYGAQLEQAYSELQNRGIRIYTDRLGKGWIKDWDNRNDSPYTSNHVVNEIMRSDDVYEKCSFTVDEEYAIIAHELGHFVAGLRGEKKMNGLQEELNADQMAVSIGLKMSMKSAIQKMIDNDVHPENNEEMEKRISGL